MPNHPVSRRHFLKFSAGAAAAGAAAPYFWSSASAKAIAGSDKLGMGSIGVGGRGSGIGREAAKFGNMLACCDVDRTHAERFAAAKEFAGKLAIYDDYRKLLDRQDIQVVTIGTPDHWHVPIALAALKAGKHVYCEKPLTLTINEGKLLCDAVKQSSHVFQVGTQQRSDFRFLLAIAIARSGRLGKQVNATCSIGGALSGGPFPTGTPPQGLNWDRWLGQAPLVPYTRERCHSTFRWWLEYSGGKLTDWGAHHVDIATWGLGFEHTGPVEIEGQGTFPNHPADFDPVAFFAGKQKIANGYHAATEFQCTLRYANGRQIVVRHGPDNGIWFEGEAGRIFVNRGKITGEPIEEIAAKMEETPAGGSKGNRRSKQQLQLKPPEQERFDGEITKLYKGKPRSQHVQNFFDCIRDGGEPVSDVFTHHRELSSCHLCNLAMLLKRKLHWDPEQQQFVGDEQANQLLSRPQRSPYAFS